MMYTVWGKKGAGKTAYAVNQIMKNFRRGGDVVTNIHLNPNAIRPRRRDGRIFQSDDPDDLRYFRGVRGDEVLFVIDESYRHFGARGWKDFKPETHELMAQSRKIHVDIIVITQGWKRIDVICRELTDMFIRFEPDNWGLGYYQFEEELSLTQENMLVPYGTSQFDTKGRFHFHRFWNWKKYDTDQLYGSLLEKLPPKKFRNILTDEFVTMPEIITMPATKT